MSILPIYQDDRSIGERAVEFHQQPATHSPRLTIRSAATMRFMSIPANREGGGNAASTATTWLLFAKPPQSVRRRV